MENMHGFNAFEAGGFLWWLLAKIASSDWLAWLPAKNPPSPDRDSVTL
jgi:hypothetical protein